MTIYLSRKLEKFLGIPTSTGPSSNERFGNWNADMFTVGGKNSLLFMNDKNCYAILMSNVKKNSLKDLNHVFRERVIAQLYEDFEINEREEIAIRREMQNITFCSSNNNRKVIGTMNNYKLMFTDRDLSYKNDENDLLRTGHLNENLLGTKIDIELGNDKYFIPNMLMAKQIKTLAKSKIA